MRVSGFINTNVTSSEYMDAIQCVAPASWLHSLRSLLVSLTPRTVSRASGGAAWSIGDASAWAQGVEQLASLWLNNVTIPIPVFQLNPTMLPIVAPELIVVTISKTTKVRMHNGAPAAIPQCTDCSPITESRCPVQRAPHSTSHFTGGFSFDSNSSTIKINTALHPLDFDDTVEIMCAEGPSWPYFQQTKCPESSNHPNYKVCYYAAACAAVCRTGLLF